MRAQQTNLKDSPNRNHFLKYIGQAKQLIQEQPKKLSTLYKQPWQNQPQFQYTNKITGKNNLIASTNINCCYQKHRHQLKDLNKVLQTNKRNNKLFKQSQKPVQQLIQIDKKDFGVLVYDRFPGRNNSFWKLTFNTQGNYQHKPFLLNIREKNNMFDTQNSIDSQLKIKKDFQYIFDSKFQSGNLARVFKQTNGVYNLQLHNDTNTLGYTHWFYFNIKNFLSFQTIKIKIVNLLRSYTLFHKGMKVLIYSQQKHLKQHVDWHRGGSSINYFQNGLKNANGNELYTLQFDYTFEYANDNVKFALNYPYNYSDLRKQLFQLVKNGALIRRIGLSVLNNEIYMVQGKQRLKIKIKKEIQSISPKKNLFRTQQKYQTIHQHHQDKSLFKKKTSREERITINNNKPIIVLMARAHPCESNSSLIMSGILQHLFDNNPESKYLLQKFQMKIFPMINPDGVIHGNSRVSITGSDLNRRWKNPDLKLHPEIYGIKRILQGLKQQGKQIFIVIDLHGHAKNQNVFLYGCCESGNYLDHANIRLFNAILGKMDENFNKNCTSFYVSQQKNSTARVVCSRQFSKYSYTLQASFFGKSGDQYHFSVVDYFQLGRNILKSLAFFADYVQPDPINIFSKIHIESMPLDIKEMSADICKNMKAQKLKYKFGVEGNDRESEKSDGGSSSNPSLYNIPQEQIRQNIFLENGINRKQKRISLQSKKSIIKKSLRGKSLVSIAEKLDNRDNFVLKNSDDVIKTQSEALNAYQCFNFKTRKLLNRSKKIMFQKHGEKSFLFKEQIRYQK